jgi:glucose-6-phosphate isomerase
MQNFKSKHPIPDLRKLLTPERVLAFQAKAAGLKLLYGAEQVSEPILEELFELAKARNLVAQLKAMQDGERVNFGERRPALHTAMRDLFEDHPRTKVTEEAVRLQKLEMDKLKTFLSKTGSYTTLIQVGIGGSSLGPEAIYLGLKAYAQKKAYFLSNVDPDETTAVFKSVDLSKTLFVIVSKSGTTLETKANEARIRNELSKAGLNPTDHLIAVTGKGSPMDNPQSYRACFYLWDYIGGRYSVTSMVGGVVLGFTLGYDNFLAFLQGAHEMDKVALDPDPHKNLPLLGALLGIWNRNFLGYPTVGVIPYSQALSRFPAHLQQLTMESNGKHVDKEGRAVTYETCPVLWGEPGTNGQHSFFQLLHQGTEVVPLELIGFAKSQYQDDLEVDGSTSQEKLLANLFAQAIALAQGQMSKNPNQEFIGGRPSRMLLATKLDPRTMGSLLAYYEHQTVFQGFFWQINSFDQEGVQLGKKLATTLLETISEQKLGKKPTYALGEAYLRAILADKS